MTLHRPRVLEIAKNSRLEFLPPPAAQGWLIALSVCSSPSGKWASGIGRSDKRWPPPVQERGRISIPLILGFSTLGVNVIFNLPSVTSTSTLST
jgi:hypothetical protein